MPVQVKGGFRSVVFLDQLLATFPQGTQAAEIEAAAKRLDKDLGAEFNVSRELMDVGILLLANDLA